MFSTSFLILFATLVSCMQATSIIPSTCDRQIIRYTNTANLESTNILHYFFESISDSVVNYPTTYKLLLCDPRNRCRWLLAGGKCHIRNIRSQSDVNYYLNHPISKRNNHQCRDECLSYQCFFSSYPNLGQSPPELCQQRFLFCRSFK